MAPTTKMAQPIARVKSKLPTPQRKDTSSLSKIKSIPKIPPILPRIVKGDGHRISPKQKKASVAEIVPRGGQAAHKKFNYLLADKANQSNRQITKLESPLENKPQTKKQLTGYSLPPAINSKPSIKEKNKPSVKVQTVIEHRHTTKIKVSPWRQTGVIKPVNEQPEPLNHRGKREQAVKMRSVSSARLVRKRRLEYEDRKDIAERVNIQRVGVSYGGNAKEVGKRSIGRRPGWWRGVVEQVMEAKPTEPVESFSRRELVARSSSLVSQVGVIRENLALAEAPLESVKDSTDGKVATGLGPSRRLVRERALEYGDKNDTTNQVDIPWVRVSYHTGHTEIDKKYMDKPNLVTETTGISYTPKPTALQVVKGVKQKFDANPKGKVSFVLPNDKLVVPNDPVQQKDKPLISNIIRGEVPQVSHGAKKKRGGYTHPDHTFAKKRLGTIKASSNNKEFNKLHSSQLADILKNNLVLRDLAINEANIKIELNLPSGNKTDQQLYKLTGFIDSDVRTAFLTVNNITQLIHLSNSAFKAEVALREGINGLRLIAINPRGEMSTKSFQLLFVPPLRGVPLISLDSPKNGMQGVREGDRIIVAGTISDPTINQAVLLVNNIPIKIAVKNGHFKKQVFLPKGRIITFRVMAKNKNGVLGYSPLHTALSAYELNINNQRPF